MKKLLVLSCLTAIFTLLSIHESKAQNITNNKRCDMLFAYDYGPIGPCQATGYATTVVPGLTTVNVLPPGMEFKAIKGIYVGSNCNPFYVGVPVCGAYPLMDAVNCQNFCGPYQALLTPAWGVEVF